MARITIKESMNQLDNVIINRMEEETGEGFNGHSLKKSTGDEENARVQDNEMLVETGCFEDKSCAKPTHFRRLSSIYACNYFFPFSQVVWINIYMLTVYFSQVMGASGAGKVIHLFSTLFRADSMNLLAISFHCMFCFIFNFAVYTDEHLDTQSIWRKSGKNH